MMRELIFVAGILLGCVSKSDTSTAVPIQTNARVLTGADQLDLLLPTIDKQRVALVVNHTSLVGEVHLVDTLLGRGINIVKIFAPEHGFRGNAADGQLVEDSVDASTELPILSLHGINRKPSPAQLSNVDVVIFDIQDVGARFYTYISTMHYVMEACADAGKPFIVLDRPNPNGGYVDGPVREPEFKYFLAMHPIPIVYGLTIGELATMIKGEGWLETARELELKVIPLKNWKHDDDYHLPVRPSPNLPNDQSIKLYPSLCLFEQTVISVGRGTNMQFQVIGNPELKGFNFSFTPVKMPGYSLYPPQENKTCYGLDLRQVKVKRKLDLSYMLKMYEEYPEKDKFFLEYFDNISGTRELRQQIIAGRSEEEIRASWDTELSDYNEMRKKYLIYP